MYCCCAHQGTQNRTDCHRVAGCCFELKYTNINNQHAARTVHLHSRRGRTRKSEFSSTAPLIRFPKRDATLYKNGAKPHRSIALLCVFLNFVSIRQNHKTSSSSTQMLLLLLLHLKRDTPVTMILSCANSSYALDTLDKREPQ